MNVTTMIQKKIQQNLFESSCSRKLCLTHFPKLIISSEHKFLFKWISCCFYLFILLLFLKLYFIFKNLFWILWLNSQALLGKHSHYNLGCWLVLLLTESYYFAPYWSTYIFGEKSRQKKGDLRDSVVWRHWWEVYI